MTPLLAVLLLFSQAAAAPEDRVDRAIRLGVKSLLARQDKDGAIQDPHQWGNRTAITALSLMALAATGHQPSDESPEGVAMKKGLDFVLRPEHQDTEGYFGSTDGSRMYGHGIVTLMLGEMLGMGVDARQDELIRERCRAGIRLILRSQSVDKDSTNAGGWRYQPDSYDSDLSASIWQVMALRSAHNGGLEVPKGAVDKAIEYIKGCYYSPRDLAGRPTDLKSAFAYGINGRAPVYSTASAGLLALPMCGKYEGQEVTSTAEWLRGKDLDPDSQWFYYGTYYYAQAMYQRGGKDADAARGKVEATLLPLQHPDGSWQATHHREQEAGGVYCTALSVLALAVKHHYLPIYQR
jgi:hypothetical protein